MCLNDNKKFPSATEAAGYYSVRQPQITSCCTQKANSAGYYKPYNQRLVFVYERDYEHLSVEERLRKIHAANKYIDHTKGAHHASKPVRCITTQEIFLNSVEASKQYNVTPACIRMACRGAAGCAGKHPITREKLKWEFIEDTLPEELKVS